MGPIAVFGPSGTVLAKLATVTLPVASGGVPTEVDAVPDDGTPFRFDVQSTSSQLATFQTMELAAFVAVASAGDGGACDICPAGLTPRYTVVGWACALPFYCDLAQGCGDPAQTCISDNSDPVSYCIASAEACGAPQTPYPSLDACIAILDGGPNPYGCTPSAGGSAGPDGRGPHDLWRRRHPVRGHRRLPRPFRGLVASTACASASTGELLPPGRGSRLPDPVHDRGRLHDVSRPDVPGRVLRAERQRAAVRDLGRLQ